MDKTAFKTNRIDLRARVELSVSEQLICKKATRFVNLSKESLLNGVGKTAYVPTKNKKNFDPNLHQTQMLIQNRYKRP